MFVRLLNFNAAIYQRAGELMIKAETNEEFWRDANEIHKARRALKSIELRRQRARDDVRACAG